MEKDFYKEALEKIKLVLLDSDGVLTSGELYYGPNGSEYKVFDVKDGLGIKLLHNSGIEVAIISIKESAALKARAKDLGIRHLIMGAEDKAKAARELRVRLGIQKEETLAVGDDLPDLGLFKEAGFKVALANSVQELKSIADITLPKGGGKGAVREICEMILKSKGIWENVLKAFF